MAANGDKTTLIKTKPRVDQRRCLVTGGAGFVGSHLCDFLISRGDYVSARGGGVAWPGATMLGSLAPEERG
jgi:hypothetical protein